MEPCTGFSETDCDEDWTPEVSAAGGPARSGGRTAAADRPWSGAGGAGPGAPVTRDRAFPRPEQGV